MNTANLLISNPFKSVVVVANTFNPSILRDHWLIENNVLEQEDILEDSVYSSNGVQIVTTKYILTATETHLQLMLREEGGFDEIKGVLLRIVDLLKHVNYTALGINFDWELRAKDISNHQLAKHLFYSEQSPVFSIVNTEDAYFGGYVSCDFLQGRMKLDIKPRVIFSEHGKDEFIHFNFNYHHDIVPGTTLVNDIILKWEEFAFDADSRVKAVVKKLES